MRFCWYVHVSSHVPIILLRSTLDVDGECLLLQDLLMVIYLTQLTKTQLQLHEKLTSVSVNQLKEYQKLIPENTN